MKKTIWIILIVLLATGSAWAKDFALTKKVGDLTVAIKIDKNPPIVGNNNMEIGLKDGSGKEVKDAKVSVDYGMPAMPGMPAMNYKASTMLHGNVYHSVVNFSMSGAWAITIKITRNGKTQSVKLNVDVK